MNFSHEVGVENIILSVIRVTPFVGFKTMSNEDCCYKKGSSFSPKEIGTVVYNVLLRNNQTGERYSFTTDKSSCKGDLEVIVPGDIVNCEIYFISEKSSYLKNIEINEQYLKDFDVLRRA